MYKKYVISVGFLMLIGINAVILMREHLLTNGSVVFLELAPIDPRSLMQGDYMALRFNVANEALLATQGLPKTKTDGEMVLELDDQHIGRFRRIVDGAAELAPNERLVRYRIRGSQVKLATNAFFFQEGLRSVYQPARYGEFRVASNGDMILTHLRDKDLKTLGQ